jgi:serine/threonine-protein kinase HipA
VGDVAVVPSGEGSEAPRAIVDVARIEEADFEDLFRRSIAVGDDALTDVSLPGVQEKVSAAMISFPVGGKKLRGAYLLKLNPPDRPLLVENEHFILRMAAACGLRTCKASLVRDGRGRTGLLVGRFDRRFEEGKDAPVKAHQEDACQFLDRYPADKYRIAASVIVEAIRELAAAPAVEVLRFLELHAFAYLVGNGDLHAKNVSLYRSSATGLVELTPAYDLLTTLAYPALDQRMAIRVDGKDDNLRRRNYVAFGERHGIPAPAVGAMLDGLVTRSEPWLDRLHEVGWPEPVRDRVGRSIRTRRGHLA